MEPTWGAGGPAPRPPMSGAAITAFVLCFVLALVSLIGTWWVNGIPFLIALLALPATRRGTRRGGGFAIATLILSGLAGIGTYAMHSNFAHMAGELTGRYIAALDKGDEAEVRKWIAEGEDQDAVLGRLRERIAKVHEAVGPYADKTTFRMGWLGPAISMVIPPDEVQEVGGDGPKPLQGEGEAVWVWCESKFERGALWVAIQIGGKGKVEFREHTDEKHVRIVRDVRFFRQR